MKKLNFVALAILVLGSLLFIACSDNDEKAIENQNSLNLDAGEIHNEVI